MSNDKLDIKKLNRNRIYRHILEQNQVSIADISYDLMISQPTATQHVYSLMKENLLVECGLYESRGGRRAKAFACNPLAHVACGINITHSEADMVIVDMQGKLIDYEKLSLNGEINAAMMQQLNETLQNMLRRNALPRERVIGVGISLPAIIDGNGKIHDTAFDWPLAESFQRSLEEALSFNIDYINDASSGGYAEFWHCKSTENLFYISLSNTVGGAVRIHNHVFNGDDFRAAEIGHVTLVDGGKPCYCGQRGCVNAYCSSSNLIRPEEGELSLFFRKLQDGDQESLLKWNTYLDYLAIAINNIRMMYDCNVILGGSVGRFIPPYIPDLEARLARRDSFYRKDRFVLDCKYHSESSAVGAALRFIDRFIDEI